MTMGIRDAEIAPLQGPGTTGMPKSEIGPGYQRFPPPQHEPRTEGNKREINPPNQLTPDKINSILHTN